MYDKGKILGGLVIFLILITSPIWYNAVSGKASYVPQPIIVTKEKQCVESTEYMNNTHMTLLQDWRETVVRTGARTYVASDGKKYNMSLTNTCLNCHPNKAEFCDQCHNYTGIKPYCWDCHVIPQEVR